MELRKAGVERARYLYEHYLVEDFPKNEVKPFFVIERSMREGHYEVIEGLEKGELVGYAFTILLKEKDRLLDYLAVPKTKRGQGEGTLFLSKLVSHAYAGMNLFLEAEALSASKDEEERKLRDRRISFYLRNGAKETKVQVFFFGVLYDILVFTSLEEVSWEEKIREIYRQVVSHSNAWSGPAPIITSLPERPQTVSS